MPISVPCFPIQATSPTTHNFPVRVDDNKSPFSLYVLSNFSTYIRGCSPKNKRARTFWYTVSGLKKCQDVSLCLFLIDDSFTLLKAELNDKQLMICTYFRRPNLPLQTENLEIK